MLLRKLTNLPLLLKVFIAIISGILLATILPIWLVRIFITFNSLFGNFLNFIVPLIILALVTPGISSLGKSAGKMLLITALIAYGFTILSGFFSFFSCEFILPSIIDNGNVLSTSNVTTKLLPYFTIEMPPLMGVMTALITSFVLGLGLANIIGDTLGNIVNDFRDIILKVINRVIIPILPIYIFGVFMALATEGEIASTLKVFLKIIILIFFITIIYLIIQFLIAAIISKRNPFKLLKNMLPAYFTALGTQSSAATIPVTLKQTIANGVDSEVAGFTVPLCATIHLSGSTMKIFACSMAILLLNGQNYDISLYFGFIMMLGVVMVAAPGVPGGAIMASLGVLESMLGFSEESIALMIALYIGMDSFGTACNVTGDGAIAVIMNTILKKNINNK